MFESVCGLFVISLLLTNCIGDTDIKNNEQLNRDRRDSYISAYHETHDLNEHDNGKVHYVDATSASNVHPIYVHNHLDDGPGHEEEYHVVNAAHLDIEHYPGPEHQFSGPSYSAPAPVQPPAVYGPPPGEYNPPVNTYGPPAPLYPKKPPTAYGPPGPVYIPPTLPPVYIPQPPPVYGPPHHKIPAITHTYFEHEPHAFLPGILPGILPDFISPQLVIAILDKIKLFKVDLFTIGKIILKFFIFKKIISFFTILFLLLVIPSLKHKGKESVGMVSSFIEKLGGAEEDDNKEGEDDDEEDGRSSKTYLKPNRERINALTRYVLNAIESFENKVASTSSPMSYASAL